MVVGFKPKPLAPESDSLPLSHQAPSNLRSTYLFLTGKVPEIFPQTGKSVTEPGLRWRQVKVNYSTGIMDLHLGDVVVTANCQ